MGVSADLPSVAILCCSRRMTVGTPMAHPLSLEEFRHLIATELQLDETLVTPQASFIEDLFVDSIRMVDLLLKLEEIGITIPPEAAWEIQTVEDAYRSYLEWIKAGGEAPAGETAPKPATG